MRQGIRTHPDAILYKVARAATPVDFADGTVMQVLQDLRDTMAALAEWGRRPLGLAAPQVGWSLRVFVMAQWPHAFVNPQIEYVVGKPVYETEECFSVPGVKTAVGRAARIKLRYVTETGEERATKMRDRDARIAQHEFDHLEGVTIVQRADAPDLPDAVAV